MRVLKKQAISRRSFLKGSTVTALGLTVMGPTIFGKNNAWSATFKNISADDGATLVQMARDIYPHDHLADKSKPATDKLNRNYKLKIAENSFLPNYLILNKDKYSEWFE